MCLAGSQPQYMKKARHFRAGPFVSRLGGLERDVVAPATPSRHRELLGLRRLGGLRRRAVLRATEELNVAGQKLDLLSFAAAVFCLPLAPVQTALNSDPAALLQVLGAGDASFVPDLDVEVVGLVLPLTGLAVFAASVHRDPQLAH